MIYGNQQHFAMPKLFWKTVAVYPFIESFCAVQRSIFSECQKRIHEVPLILCFKWFFPCDKKCHFIQINWNGIYSNYFSKLFISPVGAKQNNNYFIKYVGTGIMECVINFAYTNNCDINEKNLNELLITAEYFCYTSLVDRCAEFIASILNVQNCIALMLMTRFLYTNR